MESANAGYGKGMDSADTDAIEGAKKEWDIKGVNVGVFA